MRAALHAGFPLVWHCTLWHAAHPSPSTGVCCPCRPKADAAECALQEMPDYFPQLLAWLDAFPSKQIMLLQVGPRRLHCAWAHRAELDAGHAPQTLCAAVACSPELALPRELLIMIPPLTPDTHARVVCSMRT